MSELIAEARVLVRPDTTRFRAELEAQVTAASKGVTVPVTVTPVVSTAAAGAGAAAAKSIEQEIAGAQAATTKIADARAKALAVSSAAEATAATQRIAAREAEVAALLAQERALLAQEEKFAADRVTAETAASSARIAAKEREVAALLALDRERSAASVAASEREAAAAAAAQARALGQAGKGAASAGLAMLGLRGATLAAGGAFLGAAAGAIALQKAVGSAAQLESELNVFRVTAGATADEMKRVGDEAQALGRDITLPGVSANDAAEAMTELSKAGLSVQDSISGTRGVLQLATAAAISNADATQIAASALNSFGLAGDQAVHVADVLTNAANLAQGSISDMGISLQQASAVARQVGLSLEDTVAFLTEMAKAGLSSSDAGTSLRVSLIRLINPTEKAQEVLDKLNIQLRDAQGNIRPDVFNQFAEAQANLTRKQQDANAAIVFGTDGLRTYSIIARAGAQDLAAVRQEIDKQGSASRLAGARMQGLAGATENLKNQLSGLGLVLGKLLVPALTDFANQAAAAVGGVTELAGVTETALGPLTGLKDKLDDIRQSKVLAFAPITSPFGLGIKALGAVGNILGGESEGRRDGTVTAEAFNEAVKAKFGDIPGFLQDALDRAKPNASAAGSEAGKLFGEGWAAAVSVSVPQATQTALDLALAQASGNQDKELSVLIRKRKQQQEFLDRVLARKPANAAEAKKNAALATQAAQNLAGTKAAIQAIFDQRNADAKQAADDAERTRQKNLTDAQRKQQAFDERFLDQQARTRQQQQNRISRAEQTPQTTDDLAQQRRNLNLINAQITALNNSTVSQKAKTAAIDALVTARIATTGAINTLVRTSKEQNEAQRKQAAEDLASARLTLAQTTFDLTGKKGPLENAIDAEIKRQIGLKNAAKKGSVAFINAQIEIRRLLKQKKDLNQEAEKALGASNQGFTGFEFLQKTQGFAANLLGNLIPGFATGGLVGNISQAPIADPGLNRFQSDTVALGSQANARGVRPVQVDTTNALLRQILAAVSGKPVPIEIRRNRFTSDAVMDTL